MQENSNKHAQSLRKHNKGYRFILTVIDVFAKKAYAKPLRNKSAGEITEAFRSILRKSESVPYKIQTKAQNLSTRKLKNLER